MDDGGVTNANADIPANSREIVEFLQEIVNYPDSEIYATLVECGMDPNETVDRLLSQDTFHEVKSKREKKKKKKETQDSTDSRTRSIQNRGARSRNDFYNTSRGGRNKYNSNVTGNAHGVPSNRREQNHGVGVLGYQPLSNKSLASPLLCSDSPPTSEVEKAPMGAPSDAAISSSQPSQSVRVSTNPRQRTMADTVKMGRPQPEKNVISPFSSEVQEAESKAPSKAIRPSLGKKDVHIPSSSVLKPSADSKMSAKHLDEAHLDNDHRKAKTNSMKSPPDVDHSSPASALSKNSVGDDSREPSVETHPHENKGAEDVSQSVATGFQQLTIDNEEEKKALRKADKAVVMIPSRLRVHTSECSHIMFGSFGPGIESSHASGLNDNLDETLEAEDDSSFRHSDNKNFYEEEQEQLSNVAVDEHASSQVDTSTRDCNSAMHPETEAVQHEPPHEEPHQYKFSADYGSGNSQQLNPPSETNLQRPYLYNLPNVMLHNVEQQGHTSSIPNTLLPSGIQDARESDIHYPIRYNIAAPTLSGPSISMAEALRAASSSPQNVMPNAGPQAAPLQHHFALNSYSHLLGMPLGHYPNIVGYHYMPTIIHNQSLATITPQYRPQAIGPPVHPPSGYGSRVGASSSNDFTSNPTRPANFNEDVPPQISPRVISSQFDSNRLASSLQQQTDNPPVWHQGQQPNSRVVPGSGYYSFPAQPNLQPSGFHQAQPALPNLQPSGFHQAQPALPNLQPSGYQAQLALPNLQPSGFHQAQLALPNLQPSGFHQAQPALPNLQPFGLHQAQPALPNLQPSGFHQAQPALPNLQPSGFHQAQPALPNLQPFGSHQAQQLQQQQSSSQQDQHQHYFEGHGPHGHVSSYQSQGVLSFDHHQHHQEQNTRDMSRQIQEQNARDMSKQAGKQVLQNDY